MQAASRASAPPGLGYALIGAWANASLDKQSALQVDAFRERSDTLDFVDAVQKNLACLGVPEPRSRCREMLALPALEDEKALFAQLTEQSISELVMVDVVPLLSDERLQVRAFVTEMLVTPKGLRSIRAYRAIYDSRAPNELIDAANADDLSAFWRAGEPSRIEQEALAAAAEIERVLSFLHASLADGAGKPQFAKDLPKIQALKESGRVDCRGMPCAQVRIVRDDPPRLWVTATNTFGAYGPVIASLDENSAKNSVNVFLLVFTL